MSDLVEKFRQRQATVGVIGLGYVGLPLGETLARAGFAVLGFDIDVKKVEDLLAGRSYIHHLPAERLAPLMRAERVGRGPFTRRRTSRCWSDVTRS